jgi:hypothetical protein
MPAYQLKFPNDYDEEEWIYKEKGYVIVNIIYDDGSITEFQFYDPVRYSQEISDEILRTGFFFEKNIIVIESVEKDKISLALENIINSKGPISK